jgi:4-hydroxybutyryl-CoA dehydratase / vinylacetyl-CoA-Delta-isomerase
MAVRTREQYREGLRDDRRVHYRGGRVEDVTTCEEFRTAIDHSALAYDISHDPEFRELAVDSEPDGDFCTIFRPPRSAADIVRRGALIETMSAYAGGTIVLKEVGTDALLALLRVLDGVGGDRAVAYHDWCRAGDVAIAVAQTDVKGDRTLPPHLQPDPDHYVRVVDEDAESIVVRGAKVHTTFSANADELIVLPTRAMGPEDRDFAVAFAIPVDTPGLRLYVSPFSAGERNSFDHPISSRHKLLESLTVFDDVVVPRDRVFLLREPELAGELALGFVAYHRFTAISYKLPLLDTMVGAARLIAEMNGIGRAAHVRDKMSELIAYVETVRGLRGLAAAQAVEAGKGLWVPDQLAVNMAKYAFAHGYTDAVAHLMDLAGGLLATGPGGDDWDDPDTRKVLEKYFSAAAPAEERLRMMNLISDLTAREYGGYQAVMAMHAEGSLEAEKMQMTRAYDPTRAEMLARRFAGIDSQSQEMAEGVAENSRSPVE